MRGERPSFARAREGLRAALGAAAEPRLLFSPYRVCPLGAHVDHQDGVVTGMAIDSGVAVAFAAREDTQVRAASETFPGTVSFDATAVPLPKQGDWGNFPRGAVVALQQRGYSIKRGADLYLVGELPVGGLSSSAAVGVGYLLALEAVNGIAVSPEENVALARAIENEYVGLNSGVLDQSMILLSQKGTLLRLDCRTGERAYIAVPADAPPVSIGIAYSGLSSALVGTGYNQRVAECREAARLLLQQAGLPAPKDGARLRDVPSETYAALHGVLPEAPARRAAHFFSEQERVGEGVRAGAAGDVAGFGRLVAESGRSSVENYECGAPELIVLYRALLEAPGVYGARFSGAGFRGLCLALVEPDQFEAIGERIRERYLAAYPQYAATFGWFRCAAGPAARLLHV
ncbi:MAG TPA: galactokinase family protein [Chloroflexota bacterium]|nr:galactokinase family protein [Chloroflexota bacterium]